MPIFLQLNIDPAMKRRNFLRSICAGFALSTGLARAGLRIVEPDDTSEPEHVEYGLDIQPVKGGGIFYGWHTDGYYTKVLKI